MSISGFLQKYGFTSTERKVIYFLVITLFIGMGIRFYQSYSETGELPRFDYSAADREFRDKSDSLRRNEEGLQDIGHPEAPPATKEPAENVNINTATIAQLAGLPGIGPSLAGRIVEYRTSHGPFRTPGELMNVSGIGEKKFHKLQQYIKLQ